MKVTIYIYRLYILNSSFKYYFKTNNVYFNDRSIHIFINLLLLTVIINLNMNCDNMQTKLIYLWLYLILTWILGVIASQNTLKHYRASQKSKELNMIELVIKCLYLTSLNPHALHKWITPNMKHLCLIH